jgi:hypothetical protein
MAWFDLNGKPLTDKEAATLIGDLDARTIAVDDIAIRPGIYVTVRTLATVHAETDADGHPITATWETVTMLCERAVREYTSRQAAEQGHAGIVERFRAEATRNGVLAGEHHASAPVREGPRP